MNTLRHLSVGLALAALATLASATGSIDTTPAWNGATNVGLFGAPDTATFGQSITTDADGGVMQGFTFYLGPLDLDVKAYVYEWDGTKAVGPALFASTSFNIGDQFTGYKPVTVTTPDIALLPSHQYVLFLSSSGLQGTKFNSDAWAALPSNAYPGGEFVFHNSGNDLSTLFANAGWDCPDGCGFLGTGADLVVKVQFMATPVDEPKVAWMILAGLAFVGWTAKRRMTP